MSLESNLEFWPKEMSIAKEDFIRIHNQLIRASGGETKAKRTYKRLASVRVYLLLLCCRKSTSSLALELSPVEYRYQKKA